MSTPHAPTTEQSDGKINLLIAVAGLGIGGAEVVIENLARTLDRRRFNVTIGCIKIAGPIGEKLARAGMDIVVLADKPGEQRNSYLSFTKLRALIRQKRIQIVHTHTTDAFVDAAICRMLVPGLKLVHTFHFGNYPHCRWQNLVMEGVCSRAADRLFAVSEVQRQQIRSVYRLAERSIGRIWNGVSYRATDNGDAFRARIGAQGRLLVGTTATFIEQKGLFDLLAVAKKVRDKTDAVHFVVVGDGRLRPRLEAARRELKLDDTVSFPGWMENAAGIALPAFDIFFQPSLWEAMSISLLEAMAAGKPVVATGVGETPHIVADGSDGLVVAPRDVAGMAAALLRLIDDPELRNGLGRAAAQKVERQFTVDHMTRAYEDIYAGLLGRTSRASSWHDSREGRRDGAGSSEVRHE